MTLNGWSGEIVKPVLEDHPAAMLYFLPFILVSTFVVLNLFIALIVEAMTRLHAEEAPNVSAQLAIPSAEAKALRETLGRDRAG
jgi:voltage-gated sodium channel